MESVKYDLGYGHATPFKSPNSRTQSKSDNIYLRDDYDPLWKNKENGINLEHYDSLSDLTNDHHFYDKYLRH
jgi:hypothetical protein